MAEKKQNENKGMKKQMCEVMNYEPFLTLEKAKQVCAEKSADGTLEQYVIVRHDKDVVTDEDVARNPYLQKGSLKKPHIHIFLKFKYTRYFTEIARWFGIEPQYVNEIYSKTYNAGALYAVHANAPAKYQYPLTEAYANFDYAALVNKYKEKQIKSAAEKARDARRADIINGIMNGAITESNLSQFVTAIEEDRFNSSIRNSFTRRKRELLQNKDRNMKVVYVCGAAGSGKTTFAKMLCEVNGYRYFISGSKRDPLQNLPTDVDVIILDDLAPDVFEWKEILKLLDNHTASAAGARFSDKYVNCKMIIITNTKGIERFCELIPGVHGEDEYQFYRRVTTVYNIYTNEIEHKELDPKSHIYKLVKKTKNRIQEYIKKAPKKDNDISTDPDDIFGKLL